MPNDVINTVTIHGTTYGIGGSGGGHTIKNPAGTAMTQRSNLQFVDLTVSDDSTNDATKVENIHVIQSESELENLPDGLYMLNNDEDTVIDGNLVGYDNTTSDLNAENVQDAIDEVVEALDYLKNYVGANKQTSQVNLVLYDSISNSFTFPYDGYIIVSSSTASSGKIEVDVFDSVNNTDRIALIHMPITTTNQRQSLFVRKGMRAYVRNTIPSGGQVTYRGLTT